MDQAVGRLSKSERKAWKKQMRCNKILEKQSGIQAANFETRNLVVGNAGLVCGVTREDLLAVFESYGPIEDIIMIPEKSYAFVIYLNQSSATKAMHHLHGKPQKDSKSVFKNPLILSYVENVPEVELPLNHGHPEGLILLEDFVSEEEEQMLLNLVNSSDHPNNNDGNNLKHRRVMHFGYEFIYGSNNIDKKNPLPQKIPDACLGILNRLLGNKHISRMPDQLTVNQYQPGQGIPPHVDTHSAFEDEIISVSLGSPVVMDFRHPLSGIQVPVLLPLRSVLIMAGESRYLWTHGITPRKTDIITAPGTDRSCLTLMHRKTRTSFTFRTVRKGECSCDYHEQCDSRRKQNSSKSQKDQNMNSDEAKLLEEKYVYQVYEEIATHFSDTRHKPWPKIAAFLDSLPSGSLLLDIGCGNGKYLGRHPNLMEIGSDRSQCLLDICRDRGLEVFKADILNLPFRHGIADACICIAVIHHLATEDRRFQALQNILDVLAVGGRALIYVWAFEQQKDGQFSNYIKPSKLNCQRSAENKESPASCEKLGEKSSESEHVKKSEDASSSCHLEVHTNRTCFKQQDMLVPWQLKNSSSRNQKNSDSSGKTYHRFYHVFCEGEIDELVKRLPGVNLLESYYDKGNWCVLFEKMR